MTPEEKQKLVEELLYHRYLYYVLYDPELSDYQYDMLERQLSEEDREALGVGSSNPNSYSEEIKARAKAAGRGFD